MLNNELGLLTNFLEKDPKDEIIPWSTVAEYTEQWTWPTSSLKVAHMFSEEAVRGHRNAACFMASASELLTLVPVFMCFSSASEPAFGVMLARSVRSCLSFKSYGYSRAFAAGSSRQIC